MIYEFKIIFKSVLLFFFARKYYMFRSNTVISNNSLDSFSLFTRAPSIYLFKIYKGGTIQNITLFPKPWIKKILQKEEQLKYAESINLNILQVFFIHYLFFISLSLFSYFFIIKFFFQPSFSKVICIKINFLFSPLKLIYLFYFPISIFFFFTLKINQFTILTFYYF